MKHYFVNLAVLGGMSVSIKIFYITMSEIIHKVR